MTSLLEGHIQEPQGFIQAGQGVRPRRVLAACPWRVALLDPEVALILSGR